MLLSARGRVNAEVCACGIIATTSKVFMYERPFTASRFLLFPLPGLLLLLKNLQSIVRLETVVCSPSSTRDVSQPPSFHRGRDDDRTRLQRKDDSRLRIYVCEKG